MLALPVLLLGPVTVANAQTNDVAFTCFNFAVNRTIRAEGTTELVGDYILDCTGGTTSDIVDPGAPAPLVNFTISILNPGVQVTSRILDSTSNATEALLLIDNPTQPQAKVCLVGTASCPVDGLGASTSSPYLQPGAYNVWQGQLLPGGNAILFSGVPLAPPGTVGGHRVFRITNIRVDATGLPFAGSIAATLTTSSPNTLPIDHSPSVIVATAQKSLIVTVSGAQTLQQCFSTAGPAATVTFQKAFGIAFLPRDAGTAPGAPTTALAQDGPGANYNTESGYYNPTLTGLTTSAGSAGLADSGTRLKIVFTGINAGVTVSVPTNLDGNGNNNDSSPPPAPLLYAQLITSENGAFSPARTGVLMPDSNGSAVAVYEVLQASVSNSIEHLVVPIRITYTASPGTGSASLGTSTVDGAYAPTGTVTIASAGPIPRFAYTPDPQPDFTIVKCTSHLLFPFVTNAVGFDTGLTISNTSKDPYGTPAQSGTCTLNWYGAGGPWVATTTPSVAAGTSWSSTTMASHPGFNGYVIADCQFQYAHGFAFVTRLGAINVAMGYLALVIPEYPPRYPNPLSCPPSTTEVCGQGSREQLGK